MPSPTYAAFSNRPGTPIRSPNIKGTFFYPNHFSPTASDTRYSCSDGRYSCGTSSNPMTPTGREKTPPFSVPGRETKEEARKAILKSVADMPACLIALARGSSQPIILNDTPETRIELQKN